MSWYIPIVSNVFYNVRNICYLEFCKKKEKEIINKNIHKRYFFAKRNISWTINSSENHLEYVNGVFNKIILDEQELMTFFELKWIIQGLYQKRKVKTPFDKRLFLIPLNIWYQLNIKSWGVLKSI